jgi:hypothetical protein
MEESNSKSTNGEMFSGSGEEQHLLELERE